MAGDTRSKLHAMLAIEYSVLVLVYVRSNAPRVSEVERVVDLDNVAGAVPRTLLE